VLLLLTYIGGFLIWPGDLKSAVSTDNFNVSSMNLSLPASLSETEREEQRKIRFFAPLSDAERGWGRGQIRLVELTLILVKYLVI